ncbi:hypothetical protein GIB67_002609 [Kingdonia uniflora]|uniref:Phosphatidic acid phosphatase type 2/haloperoxidase domain-containing protein n=1 Tax=Kingdonia uniflora TaxID=39325 RepID=A0A7J7N4R5_9MAGN|nr:hypothetical protein GIB67_002609 [Kingdonia uniflora]
MSSVFRVQKSELGLTCSLLLWSCRLVKSKWLVTVLFGIAILWRHDVEAIWALMGSVINAVLSVALKKILNQERPVSTMRSDPGMPSSHAQAIFYGVIFVIISCKLFHISTSKQLDQKSI